MTSPTGLFILPRMNLDDDQVEELRKWASGLSDDPRVEVRAAGKALLMLAGDLQAARSQLLEERLIRQALEERAQQEEARSQRALFPDLMTRIRRRARSESEPTPAEEAPPADLSET
jgi:hypothetical protein